MDFYKTQTKWKSTKEALQVTDLMGASWQYKISDVLDLVAAEWDGNRESETMLSITKMTAYMALKNKSMPKIKQLFDIVKVQYRIENSLIYIKNSSELFKHFPVFSHFKKPNSDNETIMKQEHSDNETIMKQEHSDNETIMKQQCSDNETIMKSDNIVEQLDKNPAMGLPYNRDGRQDIKIKMEMADKDEDHPSTQESTNISRVRDEIIFGNSVLSRSGFETIEPSVFDLRLSEVVLKFVQENASSKNLYSRVNLKDWAVKVYGLRSNGITEDQILNTVEFAFKDSFWKSRVTGVDFLAKHFDKIYRQLKGRKKTLEERIDEELEKEEQEQQVWPSNSNREKFRIVEALPEPTLQIESNNKDVNHDESRQSEEEDSGRYNELLLRYQ